MNKAGDLNDQRVSEFSQSKDRLQQALRTTTAAACSEAIKAYYFPNPTARYEGLLSSEENVPAASSWSAQFRLWNHQGLVKYGSQSAANLNGS